MRVKFLTSIVWMVGSMSKSSRMSKADLLSTSL